MADRSTVATDSSGRQRIHRLGYYNSKPLIDWYLGILLVIRLIVFRLQEYLCIIPHIIL